MDKLIDDSSTWMNIERSILNHNISHSYIINCLDESIGKLFAIKMIQLIFCLNSKSNEESNKIKDLIVKNNHIDCLWIEPKNKSRSIITEDIELLISRMNKTAFSNMWKASIIFQSECMRIDAQNKLLKTLEEPPEKSVIILVTTNINTLLPTIISRCKIINHKSNNISNELDITDLLKRLPPENGLESDLIANDFLSYCSEESILSYVDSQSKLQESDFLSKELYDAHFESLRKKYQQKLILCLLNWFRDLLLISSNIRDEIYYVNFIDDLVRQSKKINQMYVLRVINDLEIFSKRINSSLIDIYVINDAFRKMIIN